jgi:hypothetical protein
MDKKAAGLLGVVAGLAAMGSAQAAVNPAQGTGDVLQAASYADLLKPIPDAAAALRAENAAPQLETVQYYNYGYGYGYYPYSRPYYAYRYPPYYGPYWRHHHHHHAYYRNYHHHHGYWGR